MTTKQIDILNIGLILVSAILAYHFPLQLFILSYAILGPLHYLTEINWLDTKQYFTQKSKNIWLLIGLFATLILVLPRLYFAVMGDEPSLAGDIFLFINRWSNGAIFASLLLAIGFLYIRKLIGWIALIAVALTGAILLNANETYTLTFGLLIPTIIHVYLFTLLFMLYGARKSKSSYGYLSVVLALIIPLVFVYIKIDPGHYLFSDTMKASYVDNRLYLTPVLFAKFIGISDGKTFDFYKVMELRLMMFLSFIYLYHYLNWFSKTTTIAWHKNLTMKRSLVIGILWIVMLALFYYDFTIGFLVALFFSFLHVILEFPLNIISIRNLFSRNVN